MKRTCYAAAALLLLGYATLAWSFPWNKDMADQPSPKTQASQAPPAPGSMPTTGREVVPAPITQAGIFAAKDEAAALPNPLPASPESIARGESLYQTYCLICHGPEGRGEGPVGLVFDPRPVDLNDEYTQEQADGQLFFTITRGRTEMPSYRDALSTLERWDIVNYVRNAFGDRQ